MVGISLPTSALVVLHQLARKGPLTPKEICGQVTLAPRTVSAALKKLSSQRLCRRIPNLSDMRQPLYYANVDRIKELHINLDKHQAMMRIYVRAV